MSLLEYMVNVNKAVYSLMNYLFSLQQAASFPIEGGLSPRMVSPASRPSSTDCVLTLWVIAISHVGPMVVAAVIFWPPLTVSEACIKIEQILNLHYCNPYSISTGPLSQNPAPLYVH